jgi:protein-disulfide isomerase
MSKSSAAIAIILAAVAGFFVGNITAKRGEGEAAPAATADTTGAAQEDIYRVPVGNSPSRGSRDALVTIVEFSDFQ